VLNHPTNIKNSTNNYAHDASAAVATEAGEVQFERLERLPWTSRDVFPSCSVRSGIRASRGGAFVLGLDRRLVDLGERVGGGLPVSPQLLDPGRDHVGLGSSSSAWTFGPSSSAWT
jgi:hypothetical protein